jgi:hypothetical protein
MALSSHNCPSAPTDSTRWLSSQGTLDAGGDFQGRESLDFSCSLLHQGPNGAVITGTWPSRFDAVAGLSGVDEAGGGLPDSGDNIDQAPGPTADRGQY